MSPLTTRRRVLRLGAAGVEARPDSLAVEEPLQVRVDGRPFAVTMRTPGDADTEDRDLATGFLVGEGVVRRPADIAATAVTSGCVDVTLAPGVAPPDPERERHVYMTSSCGICGTASIEAVHRAAPYELADDYVTIDAAVLAALPERLRQQQRAFARTGGLHAAGLFTVTGQPRCVREDVGRHNAVDKVVGWALHAGLLPLRGHVLQLSGRASFELVQKALLAGIPVVAAVSAPSTLAVDLATDAGMTLVGFSRGTSMNVYAGSHRIVGAGA